MNNNAKWLGVVAGGSLCALALAADGCGSGSTTPNPVVATDAGAEVASDAPGDADGGACSMRLSPSADAQTAVQTALINAPAGSTICFDDGVYGFTDELSLSTRGITLRAPAGGAVWDFRNQRATARNGLLVTGDAFTIDGIAIKNTAGDGIRVEGTSGVTFRHLKVSWDPAAQRPDDAGVARSGAYAVYPVHCEKVLIEDCEVSGARDAALYVGQSKTIIVRRNEVHDNVAGIEIENSTDAEVYGNKSHANTAGILVFNLPNLPVQDGRRANVHDNVIDANNHPNFGVPGSIVSGVPVGIGVLVMAASQTEVHGNTITGNDTTGLLMVSCFTNNSLADCTSTVAYNEWPQATYVHDNTFSKNGAHPDKSLDIVGQKTLEDMLWDGDVDPAKASDPTVRNCFKNNGTATFRDFDSRHFFAKESTDLTPLLCEYPPLPPISL